MAARGSHKGSDGVKALGTEAPPRQARLPPPGTCPALDHLTLPSPR